jgi:hypothetical protein
MDSMDVYEELDTVEAEARLWESKARNYEKLLLETKVVLLDALEDGILHIPADEVYGLISNIDEEISN